MENFIVSARKYRPQTFDTVVGQAHISSTLKNAIKSSHIAQAYLFCGPRGVGKTTCARILAKTINCFERTKTIEACDKCESCKSFNSGHSLNIYELDAASNNSVDDIRNLINQVSFAPQIGTHKVYIIDEVHMLSQQAFNAFLKTLEEPPKHAIFILATTEKHKIIPTILSRCQIFDFNRITLDDTVTHLAGIAKKEKVKAEDEALHVIAQKSDGAMRDALSIFDQMVSLSGNAISYKSVIDNLSILDYDYYFKVTDAVLEKNTATSLLIFSEILNKGFDGHNFLNGLAEHFRNLLVCQDEATLKLMEVSPAIRERYKLQSKATRIEYLLRGLSLLNKADVQYKSSRNQRLLVELALLQLCSMNANAEAEKKSEVIGIIAPAHQISPKSAPKAEAPPSVVHESKAPYEKIKEPKLEIVKANAAPSSGKINIPSPIKPQAKVSKGKMLSITDLTNGASQNSVKTNKRGNNSIAVSDEIVSLEIAWLAFAEELKANKKINLASTLTARVPIIEKDTQILFSVLNQVQEDEINSIKTDLLGYLKSAMKVPTLKLNIVVDKSKVERKPYTGEEKYQRLAEKNPAIAALREKFNLEIDY